MESKLNLRSTLMLKGIFYLTKGLSGSAIKCQLVTTPNNSR